MIQTVSVEELHNRIDELLAKVKDSADEIILSEHGAPIARLSRVAPQESGLKDRVPGCDAGKIWMAPDFNAPLPDEIVDPFYE